MRKWHIKQAAKTRARRQSTFDANWLTDPLFREQMIKFLHLENYEPAQERFIDKIAA
jgi:hypothetical protein